MDWEKLCRALAAQMHIGIYGPDDPRLTIRIESDVIFIREFAEHGSVEKALQAYRARMAAWREAQEAQGA